MEVTGVLFDFAGTLFMPNSAQQWVGKVAKGLGVDLDTAAIERLSELYLQAGLPGGPYPRAVPTHLAASYAARDLNSEAHRSAYVSLLQTVGEPHPGFAEALYAEVLRSEHWIAYADTHDTVSALVSARVAVGVISNVGFDLRPILRAQDLDVLADHCTLSYEHGAAKPDPRLFQAALADLGTSAANTLMVGDHPVADGGAAEVGCRTLLLPMTPPGSRHGLDSVVKLVTRPMAH